MSIDTTEILSSLTAFDIAPASMASSTVGVGKQSAMVDNTEGYEKIYVYLKLQLGTNPTGNRFAYLYALRGSGAQNTDGATSTAADFTRLTAPELGSYPCKASPTTGDYIIGEAVLMNPGPKFGVALVHDTVAALGNTAGNHSVTWIGAKKRSTTV